jgi:hypothetical protein
LGNNHQLVTQVNGRVDYQNFENSLFSLLPAATLITENRLFKAVEIFDITKWSNTLAVYTCSFGTKQNDNHFCNLNITVLVVLIEIGLQASKTF